MENTQENTSVIILGTAHFSEERAPRFIKILKDIIKEINPDVICLEWPEKHLVPDARPPIRGEFSDAVVPTALELGIKMVALEPTDVATRESIMGFFKEINEKKGGDTEKEQILWEFDQALGKAWVEKFQQAFNDWDAYEYFQSRIFDAFFYEGYYPVFRKYFPKWMEGWDNYNNFFLKRIKQTIQENKGKRILVTVGLDHKYWLWNKLEKQNDIILHNLQSFREAQEKE